jgi:hypothetical protein
MADQFGEKLPMRRRFAASLLLALTLCATALASLPAQAASPNFPETIALPNGWLPEGITAGHGTTVYSGSRADGSVVAVDVRTGERQPLVIAPGGSAVGVEFDRRNNRLWVAGGGTGEVRVYDASTGALLGTWTFPNSGFLNDLVVTHDAVYVTDSGNAELKVIPLGIGGSLPAPDGGQILPLGGDFAFVAGAINANGIVARAGWLIVVNSTTGKLYHVDPDSGDATEIELGSGVTVTNGDGLELQGRTLYVVRNFLNTIDVVRLAANLVSGTVVDTITSPSLDIPSTVALQAGRLWAINARFTTPPTPSTPYWITRLER